MIHYDDYDEMELPVLPARVPEEYSATSPVDVGANAPIDAATRPTGPRIVLGIDYGTTFTGSW
jgi:hypothetical protein